MSVTLKSLLQVLVGLAIIVFGAVFPGLPGMVCVALYIAGAYTTFTGLRDL